MEQNTQQYSRLVDIALEANPGDLIRHSSWREGQTVTCSTEFLRGYGNYPHAARASESLNNWPAIRNVKDGYWTFAGKYPRTRIAPRRPARPWINNVPPMEGAKAL